MKAIPFLLSTAAFALLSLNAQAAANADLSVAVIPPASQLVNTANLYTVRVSNIGRKAASNVRLVLQFPLTNTSPQRFLLGTVSQLDSRCTVNLGTVNCILGSLNKNASQNVTLRYSAPVAAAPIQVQVQAITSSVDDNQANNLLLYVPALQYHSLLVQGPLTANNSHCTGTNLNSFFECEKFPSSISGHSVVFEANGTITFPGAPEYSGNWDHPNGDSTKLHFQYWENGGMVAEFNGRGSRLNCFDGITNFFPVKSWSEESSGNPGDSWRILCRGSCQTNRSFHGSERSYLKNAACSSCFV